MDALPARRGIVRATRKEGGESLIEISQAPVKRSARHGGKPIHLPSQFGHFASLGNEVQVAARLGIILPPECTPLLKREIINEPSRANELGKRFRLLRRRRKSVAKAALNHGSFLSETKWSA
jgi:hypothetical protein